MLAKVGCAPCRAQLLPSLFLGICRLANRVHEACPSRPACGLRPDRTATGGLYRLAAGAANAAADGGWARSIAIIDGKVSSYEIDRILAKQRP
jgi:hypothetical protein